MNRITTRLFTLALASSFIQSANAEILEFAVSSDDKGDKSGVYKVQIDTTNQAYKVDQIIKTTDPSYIDIDSASQRIFAVNEEPNSGAFVYRLNKDKWQLETQLMGLGDYPCHISFNSMTNMVSVATYVSPHVSLLEYKENKLNLVKTFKHQGKGKLPRQDSPHPHWSGWSPEGKFLYSVDLGIDEIKHYYFDENSQAWASKTAVKLDAGDGPRHLAFHPYRNFAYLINEISNTLVVLEQDLLTGQLSVKQRLNTLDPNWTKHSQAAAIRLSDDGQYIYVANRGENSIAVFKIDQLGEAKHIQSISTGGNWPRDFNFSENQDYILVGNKKDHKLNLFTRDVKTGLLAATNISVPIKTPKFVEFWPF